MLRLIISFSLAVVSQPYGGDAPEPNPITLAVLLVILAIVAFIGAVSVVKAVKSEKRARSMQQSAEFTSQLLSVITEAQKAAETPLTAPAAAPENGTDDAHEVTSEKTE